jgi:autonomous glycyl radical cofactor GrcA
MRTLASHLAVFLIGVILATAAGAVAHPTKQPSLTTRLKRLEVRHDALQANYQTFCNTLKFANMDEIQDVNVRDLFTRLTDACWTPPW